MSKWIRYSVAALIRDGVLQIGDGYRAKNSELSLVGVPFARAGNIDGHFDFDGADCLSEASLDRIRDKVSLPGDVLFTSKGTVGRVALVSANTPRFVYSPQLCYWRVLDSKTLDAKFLSYWMQGPEFAEQVDALKGQTDMADYVSLIDQRGMTITAPSTEEQRAIAAVLGVIDDKIVLHRRTEKILERMAAVIFSKWLSDNEHLLLTVKVKKLGDDGVLLVNDGYRAKNSEMDSAGLPFARAGNLNNGFRFTDADLLGVAGVRSAGDKLSRPYDSVFTSKGTVGRNALVMESTPAFVYSPQLCFWRSLDFKRLNPFVLFRWMRGDEFREQVDSLKGQTDMADYVNLTDQREMEMTLPWAADQKALGELIGPLVRMVSANGNEIRALVELRRQLMSPLLSGELRIKEPRKTVNRAS